MLTSKLPQYGLQCKDLRWTQVLVEDGFAHLDVLVEVIVVFPIVFVDADSSAQDVVVHLLCSSRLMLMSFRERTVDVQLGVRCSPQRQIDVGRQ